MPLIPHNLIEAISWSIIHSLWISAVIYAVLLVLFAVLRKAGARARYMLAYGSLCLMFISFAAVFLSKVNWGSEVSDVGYLYPLTDWPSLEVSEDGTGRLLQYLSFGYLAGLCLQTVLLMVGYYRIYQIQHKGLHDVPVFWTETFQRTLVTMDIRRPVRFRLSDRISTPLIAGYFKPLVLFPVAMATRLDMAQVEAILIHELSHIRRNDYLFNLFKTFMETILFFNPFVWLVGRIIQTEREHACDDMVLAQTGRPVFYAQTLLQVALLTDGAKPGLAMAATGTAKSQLFHRIKRITDMKTKYINIRQQLLVLAFAVLAAVSLAWVQSTHIEQQAVEKSGEDMDASVVLDSIFFEDQSVSSFKTPLNTDTAGRFEPAEMTVKKDSAGSKLHVIFKNSEGDIKEYHVDKLDEIRDIDGLDFKLRLFDGMPVRDGQFALKYYLQDTHAYKMTDSLLEGARGRRTIFIDGDSLRKRMRFDAGTMIGSDSLFARINRDSISSKIWRYGPTDTLLNGRALAIFGGKGLDDSLVLSFHRMGKDYPHTKEKMDSLFASVKKISGDSLMNHFNDLNKNLAATLTGEGVFRVLSREDREFYNSEEYKALREKFEEEVAELKRKRQEK